MSYQNGKIYKIVNSINDTIYVGSTKNKLCKRMTDHRLDAKTRTTPFYTAMREIGLENFKILLIKNFPCSDRNELTAEEYRVMGEMKDNGVELYNSFIGEMSVEHKKKLSESMKGKNTGKHHNEETKRKISEVCKGLQAGEKHHNFGKLGKSNPKFNYGGISYCKRDKSWIYQWKENKKQKRKSFSPKKYTEEGAIQLCRDLRKKIYPSYTTKYCEWFYIVEKDEFLVFPPS